MRAESGELALEPVNAVLEIRLEEVAESMDGAGQPLGRVRQVVVERLVGAIERAVDLAREGFVGLAEHTSQALHEVIDIPLGVRKLIRRPLDRRSELSVHCAVALCAISN